jgi:arylsulfatase A-like enzyme/Tfp pilus assembly protein PilF
MPLIHVSRQPDRQKHARNSFAIFGFTFLLFLTSGCRRNEKATESIPKRDANILLITLDTTRADHLSCYSGLSPAASRRFKGANTRHLDALSRRGVLFARATAQAPLTLPSHASMMTGKYPPLHGLRGMEGFALDKPLPTLASITQANGFATAAFVGSRVLARHFGLANGFASYDDDMGSRTQEDSATGVFAERRAAAVTERALGWLKANAQSRFFLWAHYFDPHTPYDPPEPYKHAYAQDAYSGEIAYMDEQVGRLLDGLAQMGLAPRTLIAVIGDHGESLGEHGEMTHGVFLYESTLHIPFILAGPGVPAGKVITEQVRSIDLMPTLLDLAKLPSSAEAQGVSLSPLMRQGTRAGSDHSYSETLYPRIYMGWSELRAMRTAKWKFIAAPRPELYNLENDPSEERNLISMFPSDAEQLRKDLWKIAGVERRQEKLATRPADGKTLRELESLGYLSGGSSSHVQLGSKAPDPKDRVDVLKILTQVEDLLSSKNYARVAKLMEEGLRLDPTNPRGHLYLATAYEQMGQYQRAIDVLQHAVDVKVRTDKVYSRLGVDYLHLRQLDKAIDAMERASRLNPGDLNNLLNLGMACLQLGRVDDAEKIFRSITDQNERYAAAHNGLGLVAVQRGDAETARREFERAIEVDPNEVKSLLDLGILHQQMGNREQALHYLLLFTSRVPEGQFAEQLPAVHEAIRELKGNLRR